MVARPNSDLVKGVTFLSVSECNFLRLKRDVMAVPDDFPRRFFLLSPFRRSPPLHTTLFASETSIEINGHDKVSIKCSIAIATF